MSLPQSLSERLRLPVVGAPLFIISNPDLVIAQTYQSADTTKLVRRATPVLLIPDLATLDDIRYGHAKRRQHGVPAFFQAVVPELFRQPEAARQFESDISIVA